MADTKEDLRQRLDGTIKAYEDQTRQLQSALRRINTLNIALDAMADEIARLKITPPPRTQ